jgi:lantibiotic leader peptide-processing serine protease
MKARYSTLALASALLVAACAESPVINEPTALSRHAGSIAFNAEAVAGNTYLIKFNGNDVPAEFAATVASLGGEVIFAHSGAGIAAVSGISEEGADALAASNGVTAVEADAYTTIDPTEVQSVPTDVLSPTTPQTPAVFAFQWNMRAISAPAAWASGKLGSSATKVGILDTGLDYTHPDLAGRVDLALSKSFLSAQQNQRVQDAWPGAHNVLDLHFHGTHVGATVASNAILAAGVTSQTKLVGLKVCEPGVPNAEHPQQAFVATCPTNAVIAAMLYAADNNIPVINMSLGGLFLRRQASARGGFGPSFIALINSVFHYVNKKGTLVVVAAGNVPVDLQHFGQGIYGAYCDAPDVICVSATGPTAAGNVVLGPWENVDAITSYSTIGKNHVTVAAPGGSSFGFIWAACSTKTIALSFCAAPTVVGLGGTSMASPHVAGLAALIAAEGGHTPASITNRIIATSDDLGPKGKDAGYGAGRINVFAGTR